MEPAAIEGWTGRSEIALRLHYCQQRRLMTPALRMYKVLRAIDPRGTKDAASSGIYFTFVKRQSDSNEARFGPSSGRIDVWYDQWEILVGDSIVEKVFNALEASKRHTCSSP
jgi:hypothetical protein